MSEDAEANRQLIARFYDAFNRRDGDAMAACYAANARFRDPVFQELRGEEPGAMWRMLTSRADDLRIELAEHDADETTGTAHWLADYTFTQTGRKVHNDVRARFRFAGGLIVEHDDSFGFHTWARQALGPAGTAAGMDADHPRPVRRRARAGLDDFMAGEDS